MTSAPPSSGSLTGLSLHRHRLLVLGALASGAAVGYLVQSRADPHSPYKHSFSSGLGLAKAYYALSPRLLPFVDPERGHRLAVSALALPPSARWLLGLTSSTADPPALHQSLWGLSFPNPLGLAAGFDKHAECVDGALEVGFGWVEVGSVTPEPQEGNARPRVFRLQEDAAVINRYGFNSEGVDRVRERLEERVRRRRDAATASKQRGGQVVGINLGKNKTSPSAIADYTRGLRTLGPFADYAVVNVSSPNTPNLRDLQHKEQLHALLSALLTERDALTARLHRPLPLLLKVAPDLSPAALDDIASTVLSLPVDGLIVSNTTLSRPPILRSPHRAEEGGLSGRPLRELSTRVIRELYVRTEGRVPIIGVGGVESGDDVVEKMRAGATLVQMYSAFSYGGPVIVSKIKDQLVARVAKDGVRHVSDLVGLDAKDEIARNKPASTAPKRELL